MAVTSSRRSGRRFAIGVGASVFAVAWSVFALLAHWMLGFLSCGLDTSYCAHSREKNGIYAGVLRDRRGDPVTDSRFRVTFESRHRSRPGPVGGFSTDRTGHYCIVWASERITPFFEADDGARGAIEDPWRPLNGAAPPRGCQPGDQGIPWNRADDLERSPQFVSVAAIGFASIALLLVGLVRNRARFAGRVRALGVALAVAMTIVGAVLWFL